MRVHTLTLIVGACLCLAIGLMSPVPALGQTKTVTFGANDAFFLPGLGAIILSDGKNLKIDLMPSSENMPKEFRSIDLKQGDKILMLNGKRVKTIAELREKYESLAVADSVEFGIKRGKSMQIVSYLKPDDEMHGGGQKVMMMTSEGPPPGADSEGAPVMKVMTLGGDDGPLPIIVMEAGVLFAENDDGVEVIAVIGNAQTELTGGPLKEGDRLVSCQGKPVTGGDAFSKQFESIKVGTTVTLVYTRDGDEQTVSFAKGKAQKMMMKKTG